MIKGPERIFVDPRVARTMPQELHETVAESIAYVRQDLAEKAAQMAADTVQQPDEYVVQISTEWEDKKTDRYPMIIVLTNLGRIYINSENTPDEWIRVIFKPPS